MGRLRDKVEADRLRAGRADSTRAQYTECAARIVKHFMRPPDQMDETEVCSFRLHLAAVRNVEVGTYRTYLGALKLLYGVTHRWLRSWRQSSGRR